MKTIKSVAIKATLFFLVMTLFCGLIYPLVMTGASQLLFKDKANGSIIEVDGKKYGSVLLAQSFTGDNYLWGRIMSLNTETFTDKEGNPRAYSGPSNLSPASPEFEALVAERVEKLKASNPAMADAPVPVDLVTNSGSGLDPHISPAAAEYQVSRLATARGISEDEVRNVITSHTNGRFLGIMGEPVVNVLEVNLALDGILK